MFSVTTLPNQRFSESFEFYRWSTIALMMMNMVKATLKSGIQRCLYLKFSIEILDASITSSMSANTDSCCHSGEAGLQVFDLYRLARPRRGAPIFSWMTRNNT